MRLFIAVPVPEPVREELQQQAERCFDADMLRLVRGEGIHITLLFIGEQETAYVRKAEEAFHRLKNTLSRFTISFSGIITFPYGRTPRVVAVPVVEGMKELRNMHHKLAEILDGDKRKKYTPHITLGRVRKNLKDSKGSRAVHMQDICRSGFSGSGTMPGGSDLFTGSFTADQIVLYASVLEPAGARYRELASCSLS